VRLTANLQICDAQMPKLTTKGRVTIPLRIRTALGLQTGDRIEFVEVGKGEFNIVAATRSVRELSGFSKRKGRKPVSIQEMNAAIAKGASRSR
jgi:antitoxin PrlF